MRWGLPFRACQWEAQAWRWANRFDDYDVLLLKKDGTSEVYEEVRSKE